MIVCTFSKSTSFIAANPFHSSWIDIIFILLTSLGDGLFALFLVLLFIFLKRKDIALKLVFTFLLSGGVAQLLKAWFHAPRPKLFFSPQTYTHFIDGVTNSGMNSFPSGHATTAFAIACILACNIACKKWCSLFFILAALIVYSRIYLGQHFIEDTLAGIIIGMFSSIITELLYLHLTIYHSRKIRIPVHDRKPLTIEL